MSHSKYLTRSRGVSRLYAHLVLVTKYRLDTIDSVGFAPLEVLKKYVQNQGEDCSSPLRSDSQAFHTCGEPNRLCDSHPNG